MVETELCKLAYKYGTDRCPRIWHPYTPFYYNLFKDRRESVKKVLEMGIGSKSVMRHIPNYLIGAGLYMWRDFFPNAHIYGADNDPETIFQADRITTHLCDERVKEDLESLIENTGSDIDFFIDDGSHTFKDQVFLCKTILPMLKDDVVYIIEDLKGRPPVKKHLSDYDTFIPPMKRGTLVVVSKKGTNGKTL